MTKNASKYTWTKSLTESKNIFLSGAQVIINPVNCVGVMGKGLALQFKNRYPALFTAYNIDCNHNRYTPGCCVLSRMDNGQWIANIATKNHWRDSSKKEWVIQGIRNLLSEMADKSGFHKDDAFTSVAIPRIGCGLGNLDWDKMRPLIIQELKGCHYDVWLDGKVFLRNKEGINEMKENKKELAPKQTSLFER